MISNILEMLGALLKNSKFYIVIIISVIVSFNISNTYFTVEGIKMIPVSIGVVLGGLLSTIAIIFGIIRDKDLDVLFKKHGDKFFISLHRLKYHILLIAVSLFASIFSFFINAPKLLVNVLNIFSVSVLQFFYFLQIFFSILTLYLTIEVINILFMIFEIKFNIVKKRARS